MLVTFHTVLASVGRDTPIEKMAEITDDVADVTSNHMMSIDGIRNSASDHLFQILETQKRLETKIDKLSRRMNGHDRVLQAEIAFPVIK